MIPFFKKKNRHPVYLDHAAATFMSPRVFDVYTHALKDSFYNPGGLYFGSIRVADRLAVSRLRVAEVLGCRSQEVFFVRGGTESVVLGLSGFIDSVLDSGMVSHPHVVTSAFEHSCVRDTLYQYRDRGLIELTEVDPNDQGVLDPKHIARVLREDTILVSLMMVNNEIGTIQPVRDIAKVIRSHRKNTDSVFPYFHTDAIAALNTLDVSVEKLGVDLLSLSGSKIYGPRSIGVLYKRSLVPFTSPLRAGGQEMGVRGGTEDVAGSIAFACALEETVSLRDSECDRLRLLQEYCLKRLDEVSLLTECTLLVTGSTRHDERIPSNIHILVHGIPSERLVLECDAHGVFVSSRSACSSDEEETSHVLRSLGLSETMYREYGALRITFGRDTTRTHIDRFLEVFTDILLKRKAELAFDDDSMQVS